MKYVGCSVKRLPDHLHVEAARTAVAVNPANAPLRPHPAALSPLHIAGITSKFWPAGKVLGVKFLDAQTAEFRAKVLAYANKWAARGANVKFVESASSSAEIRITRTLNQGYYSYLGTDCLHIPAGQNTMNLEAFSMSTPDSEYDRVVCHEFGHALGWVHEHMRPAIVARVNKAAAYAYFGSTQGWSPQEIDQQVLTPLDESTLRGTQADTVSIMCYGLPAQIMADGKAVPGGLVIDDIDYQLVGQVYPPAVPPSPPVSPPLPALGQIVADLDARRVALPAGWAAK